MRVKITVDISGRCGWTGENWPRRGEYVTLPYEAAQKLIASGMASVPDEDAPKLETAVMKAAEELATPPAPRGRPKLPRDKDGNPIRPKQTKKK